MANPRSNILKYQSSTCRRMAATTTIRITSRGKRELERLTQRWASLKGARPTQQEVLESGLAFLVQHESEFLRAQAWRPMTAAEITELRELPAIIGGWTGSWEDIDAVLYDDP